MRTREATCRAAIAACFGTDLECFWEQERAAPMGPALEGDLGAAGQQT